MGRPVLFSVAGNPHGRAELSRKLRQRGATAELIDPAHDRLAEEGLLDETRYLESFIASRARSGHG
ncbi:regulatory protein RecX, partial [Pseudomonas aeruginosa]|uniref:regulatory protein RecX n=1 Tax=Pseudomonas aeruginosa TaxID=287 RepID=UPI003CC62D74